MFITSGQKLVVNTVVRSDAYFLHLMGIFV